MYSQAGKYAFRHRTSVRTKHELQHEAARRKEVRIRRLNSLCRQALEQHMVRVPAAVHAPTCRVVRGGSWMQRADMRCGRWGKCMCFQE